MQCRYSHTVDRILCGLHRICADQHDLERYTHYFNNYIYIRKSLSFGLDYRFDYIMWIFTLIQTKTYILYHTFYIVHLDRTEFPLRFIKEFQYMEWRFNAVIYLTASPYQNNLRLFLLYIGKVIQNFLLSKCSGDFSVNL